MPTPYPNPFFAPAMTVLFVGAVPLSENEPVGKLPVPRTPSDIDWADSAGATSATLSATAAILANPDMYDSVRGENRWIKDATA